MSSNDAAAPTPGSDEHLTQLYNQADKLKDQGDLEQAAKSYEEILTYNEGYALAHSALAVVLTRQGKHDEAIAHARRVVELEPDDSFSYTALSVTCQRAGRIQDAEDALARAHAMAGR